jgi:hypothetical protein
VPQEEPDFLKMDEDIIENNQDHNHIHHREADSLIDSENDLHDI